MNTIEFFERNYQTLVGISTDYCRRYNYTILQPDEVVSELMLFTITKPERQTKLEQLMQMTADTINSLYSHSTKAMYYLVNIIYRLTSSHREFSNNCSKNNNKLVYVPSIYSEDVVEEIIVKTSDNYTKQDVLDSAKRLSFIPGNEYKYKLWFEHYENGLTYKQLSTRYLLTVSPIWYVINGYNHTIRQDLIGQDLVGS